MKKKVHVISHTHWDREWYFTVDDSKVLMAKAFDEVIETLEKNAAFEYYLLDGQTSILEEYFSLKPENFQRVKELIESGRLITGPWYTQPDVFNVHGESIVRNLMIGMKQAEQYGGGMDVGYLPDTFGFNPQMPLIYDEMGIKHAIIRRGYDPEVVGSTEFYWESVDGNHEVLTAVQPYGYSMGHPRRGARYRNFSESQLFSETFPMLNTVKKLSDAENVMMTIGGDQVSIDENIELFVAKINELYDGDDEIFQSSLTEYFLALERENSISRRYQGEFRDARYARVHRTIGSSRYDIKKANFDAEQHLLRVAEVMNALCAEVGIYYDTQNVERAWKLLLESHAHDSMGGCNSDLTNDAVLERCVKAHHTSKGIFAQQARLLANNIERKGYDSHFIVVNGSYLQNAQYSQHQLLTGEKSFKIFTESGEEVPFIVTKQETFQKPRKVILTPEGEKEVMVDEYYYITDIIVLDMLIERLGYSTYYIKHDNQPCEELTTSEKKSIENNRFELKVENQKLIFVNKETGKTIEDFIRFEDTADDGDLYDYSPLVDDHPIIIKDVVDSTVATAGEVEVLEVTYKPELPLRLNDERIARVEETVEVTIIMRLMLKADGSVDTDVTIQNMADDHRMRIIFNPEIQTTETTADVPFGRFIRHEENIPADWNERFEEYPIDIYPLESMVSVCDENEMFTLYSKGGKEYQLLENKLLALTLFKGVGTLGKADLSWRPGRESGRDTASPKAQLNGELHFELAFDMLSMDADVYINQGIEKERFLTPFASYQSQEERRDFQQMDYFDIHVNEYPCPSSVTLVNTPPKAVGFSSIMTLEDKTYLLRSTNLNDVATNVTIDDMVGNGEYVNFNGEKKEGSTLKEVKANDAFTIKFTK